MTEGGKRFVVVHGHFYQPPRENPWVDAVEMQPSAWPHHDWNERVYAECYAPNGSSRLLDDKGRIRDIVNNYAHFSFDVGPTLMSWIEEKHRDTYEHILAGDRISRERLGHGNALAHVYNHLIMPLATADEKSLQIRWGIRDFERRFGRKPEGMWLAETAIDMETVCCLIREGIRFTVLAPTQALRMRPLSSEHWKDVSDNSINPHRPYRIFPLDEDGTPLEKGYLDVFFYDGPLSHGVGFEHLLTDAHRFADHIAQSFDPHDLGDQLVSVCTDGESYGHHEAFADMCAAYFFRELCAPRGLVPVNYAWYLERHPPEFEVRIKNAYSGGTAWSCAHGVGRWKEDCGCSTGAAPGWNQKWRAPLRAALDVLAQAASAVFNREGPERFHTWEEARSQAPEAWDLNPDVRQDYWRRHGREGADGKARELIELLRFSHYMYTSCGWFFADITGLETAQVLKYALRVLQLLEARNPTANLRTRFLTHLAEAKSNLGGKRGDEFFQELEKGGLPVTAFLALAHWAQEFSGESVAYARTRYYRFVGESKRNFSGWSATEFRFRHEFENAETAAWLAFTGDGIEAHTYVLLPEARQRLVELDAGGLQGPDDLMTLDAVEQSFRLAAVELPIDIREKLATALRKRYWRENSSPLAAIELQLSHRRKQYTRLDWPFPSTMLQMLHVIENFHLVEEIEIGLRDGSVRSLAKARDLAQRLRGEGWHVHLGAIKREMYERMLDMGQDFMTHTASLQMESLFLLLDLVDILGLTSERTRLENIAFPLYLILRDFVETGQFAAPLPVSEAVRLLDRLNFNTEAATARLLPKAGT